MPLWAPGPAADSTTQPYDADPTQPVYSNPPSASGYPPPPTGGAEPPSVPGAAWGSPPPAAGPTSGAPGYPAPTSGAPGYTNPTSGGAGYGATPVSGGGYPQQGYAQPAGYPQQGYAQPGYTQPGYTQPAYPQQAYPVAAYQQQPPQMYDAAGNPLSDKSKIVAGVLGIALGGFGAGRFYTGHTGIAVAQLLVSIFTCGLGHFWGLIDGIMILANGGTDAQGRTLRES